jgi:hypothetical protein
MQSVDFIVNLFGKSTGQVYLSTLPNPELKDTPEGEPNERHIWTRNSEQIDAFIAKWNRPGRGTYLAVSTFQRDATSRCKDTVQELIALHADIDFRSTVETPEEILQIVRRLTPAPCLVIHSGHGLHLYWMFKEPIPAASESKAEHDRLLRRLADYLGADTAVAHCAALMRLPGTTNSKNGEALPVHVIIEHPNRYALEELKAWLQTATPVIHRKGEAGNGHSPDNPFAAFAETLGAGRAPIDVEARLAAMQHEGPGDSGIHITQRDCSAALLNRGAPIRDVVRIILDATHRAAGAPGESWNWTGEETKIRGLCNSWLTKHPELLDQESETQTTPHGWWHGDVDIELTRKYLIKKLIPETGTGLLPGQWGTYKTFVAVDLAGAVMTGTTFAGHPVKRKGGVLFVACEGRAEIPIRLEALNRTKCGRTERLPFFCLDTIPHLLKKGAAEKIAADASHIAAEMRRRFDLPLVLIIIDTVAAGAGYSKAGEENDAAIAQRIMDTLAEISKRTGAFVLAVDHFGKAVETGTRGSSAKESFADIVLALLGEKELAGAVKNPRMAARKRRGGPNGEVFAFTAQLVVLETDEDGDPVDTLVIEWGGSIDPADAQQGKWPKSTLLLRRIMMTLLVSQGVDIQPEPDGATVRAIDREFVREEFNRSYPADGDTEEKRRNIRRQRFFTAIKNAQERRLIDVRNIGETTYLWLTIPLE